MKKGEIDKFMTEDGEQYLLCCVETRHVAHIKASVLTPLDEEDDGFVIVDESEYTRFIHMSPSDIVAWRKENEVV